MDRIEAGALPEGSSDPVILLVKAASGDEEVGAAGANLKGVILSHSLPHLSHLGAPPPARCQLVAATSGLHSLATHPVWVACIMRVAPEQAMATSACCCSSAMPGADVSMHLRAHSCLNPVAYHIQETTWYGPLCLDWLVCCRRESAAGEGAVCHLRRRGQLAGGSPEPARWGPCPDNALGSLPVLLSL